VRRLLSRYLLMERIPAGLSVYALTYACGLAWSGTAKANPDPLDLNRFIELAAENGLQGVEFPARMLPDTSPEALRAVRRHAEARGLAIVLAAGRVERDHLAQQIELARQLGAPAVRCVLSGILCGDRRALAGGWNSHLLRCAAELEAALPVAERARTTLAVENHQDATSGDLLWLCRRFESEWLGVTLDTGNPLAVMEEPLEFAARLAPYLRNVHLKDYRIYCCSQGFRLARCPLGDGAVDFPALFRLLARACPSVPRSIELGALQARLIPFLEASWWDEYPPRDTRRILSALRLAWRLGRAADEDWRTPLERDATGEELAVYERNQLDDSVRYLRDADQWSLS
jgi:sugar phosphate isomerase/epimerase